MSLHVFALPPSSEMDAGEELHVDSLEPVSSISTPTRLKLPGSEEGLFIDLVLEQVCLCCGGSAFVPVTVSESCSTCGGAGREHIDGEKLPCSVCDGTCWVPIDEMDQCERCDGTGLELTATGRRLLHRSAQQLSTFLNRWGDWRGAR